MKPDTRWWPTVYAIRHNPTGKIYVGSTKHLETRLRQHISALMGGRHSIEQMQKDCDEYGADYSFCILACLNCGSGFFINRIESLYMTILGTRDPARGYNYKDPTTDHTEVNRKWKALPFPAPSEPLDPRRG